MLNFTLFRLQHEMNQLMKTLTIDNNTYDLIKIEKTWR